MTARRSVLPDASAAARGRVLVVDDDFDVLERIADAVRALGHLVALATDGRSGLERAVELAAEVVVVDRDVGVLDVRTFLDVLGDNPRTADAHVFVMGHGDPGELATLAIRAEPLVKPLHAQEVASRIDEVIRARRSPPKERELEGDLSQVALFDLLQVFAQNRRTGELRVESEGAIAAIWLVAGRIVDASASTTVGTRGGSVVGEKALYRTLALRSGRFVFHPERRPSRARIDMPTSHLLMEAVRRSDERAALETKLPARGTQLRLAGRPRGLDASTELVEELVAVLEEPRTIEELLDLVPAHDLELLGALVQLLDRGVLQTFDPVRRVRFCDDEEVPAMRAAILRLRRPGTEGGARLGVVGSAAAVASFSRALAGIDERIGATEPPTPVGSGLFGPLGRLRVGGTELELFALPIDPELRAWWSVFLGPSRAVLLLDGRAHEPELRVVEALPSFDLPSGAVQCVREALSAGTSSMRRSGEWAIE